MDSGVQHLKNAAFKGHLLTGYATEIILYKNKMTRYFGMTMLNTVPNRKVNNVSKPIESKRSSNHIINNSRYSIVKLFRDIVWRIEGK